MKEDPTGRLPEETFDAPKLIAYFGDMGLSPREFVALSGSHTVRSPQLLLLSSLPWLE